MLKFREMEGTLAGEDVARWDEIKRRFGRNLLMGGQGENDPVSRVVGTLAGFSDGLSKIEDVIGSAAEQYRQPQTLGDQTIGKLEEIIGSLRAVPVNVEIKVVPVQESGEPLPEKEAEAVELPVDVNSVVEQPTVKKAAKKKAAAKKATSKKAPAKKASPKKKG